MNRYKSINIGDKAEITHVITLSDIEKFVDLTGDDNKLHTDNKYASNTSFKKPVAHGMLGASFISTVLGTKLPGDGALWFSQSLEFLLPIRVGDKLKIVAEVLKKIDRTTSIELKTEIYNQNKQKVTTGIANVKIVDSEENKSKKEKPARKTVLVIGGTGGIGSATCLQLANDKFDVVIHYNKNRTKAEQLKKIIVNNGQIAGVVKGSIFEESNIDEIKEQSQRINGEISVVVNCATIPIPTTKFSDLDWSNMQDHYDANIKSSFNILKAFSKDWESNKFGKYIGLTTLYTEQPKSELLAYITAKTALNGFIKALSFELAPKGIRLNLVSPGMVDTPLIADVPEKVRLLSAAQTPLRSIATPEDIANAIAFLASDKSNYLTGETIRVNGGQVML